MEEMEGKAKLKLEADGSGAFLPERMNPYFWESAIPVGCPVRNQDNGEQERPTALY